MNLEIYWWGDNTNDNQLLAAMKLLVSHNHLPHTLMECTTMMERMKLCRGALNPGLKVGAIMVLPDGKTIHDINTFIWAAASLPLYC